jgi:hypothetical protein
MRRFARAFLTTSAILVLAANLVMIMAYGRQFYACSEAVAKASVCVSDEPRYLPFLVLNLIAVGTLAFIWLAIRAWVRAHRRALD